MLDRWHIRKKERMVDVRVDAFLTDVIEVCKKHNLSISHEDTHGAFIVEEYSEENAEWLLCAQDDTTLEDLPNA